MTDDQGSERVDAAVRLSNVTKWYGTNSDPVHAVESISLEATSGEFISLVGPSGCGKSTLLLMIAGLIPHTSGTIHIDGHPVTAPVTELGFVFQKPVLLDWYSVLENVMLQAKFRKLDPSVYRDIAVDLLQQVGLGGLEDRPPYTLSGGMQQRVAICRALLHTPSLVLMDEPFGALDALTRDQLNIDLQELWLTHGSTIVFVTHSITEAVFLSDRVVVMSQNPGQIETIIDVDLPRARHLSLRDSPEFGHYTQTIYDIFGKLGVLRDE